MLALLAFALTLLVAVLVSALAHRSVLSISVLFLVSGFAFGSGGLGWLPLKAGDPAVMKFIEIAMFAVLFADGMEVRLRDLRKQGSLTARALLIGMPLSILALALLARFAVGLPWLHSFLLAAALSPTDPVLASALVGREEAPERLRKLLNLESGSRLGLRELAAASWFGPRGFSSVFFALLILGSSAPQADLLFRLMAVVIAASIVLHSSTDVLVARWFEKD
jgi:NhaP-type Na+/H+ or K+/H+ antiporter